MDVRVYPGKLQGKIAAIPSKSAVHRSMITAALADKPTVLLLGREVAVSRDIEATAACIKALGGQVEIQTERIIITPITQVQENACLDCGESGTTLRFLLPIAAALGKKFSLQGHGRLAQRPLADLCRALESHGCLCSSYELPISVQGKLMAGKFSLPGDVSSQYISGLLLAAPLLAGATEINLTSPLQSAGYVEMTRKVMVDFGVDTRQEEDNFFAKPGKYISPGEYLAEGDWSNAAFWLTANILGSEIEITGLEETSAQPDKAVRQILAGLGKDAKIDVSACPDLLPILAMAAACSEGETTFTNAARLRLKESDRISTVTTGLKALGISAVESPDSLQVTAGKIQNGTVFGCNDHRLVMSWAIAALVAQAPIVIIGAEAVNKSYPDFWQDYESLGGKFDVL